jgi:glycosyltransferase involved in cell wall biosynthesis
MKKILLSIIIPTKNREEYLLEVVKNILSIEDNRFELVVQDNSDAPTLQTKFNIHGLLKDERLRYFYNSGILSFVDNFGKGISKCNGEYITIIGDDDTINPTIMDVVQWASENNISAIKPSLPLIYYWPNSGVNPSSDSGRLTISQFNCNVKFYNTKKELRKLLKDGCQNYLSYNLAKVYHGVVKRTVLEQLKSKTGYFIGGLSPDIYLSVGVSALIDKVLVMDYPLTISGICKKSGSADSATGRHTGKLSQAPHFNGHINYKWSKKVPDFYSVETIWGDSAMAAIDDIDKKLSEDFNVEVISAYCLNHHPDFRNDIIKSLSANYAISENSIVFKFLLIKGYLNGPVKNFFRKIINILFYRRKVMIFDNIIDIDSATKLIQNKTEIQNKNIITKLKKQFNVY